MFCDVSNHEAKGVAGMMAGPQAIAVPAQYLDRQDPVIDWDPRESIGLDSEKRDHLGGHGPCILQPRHTYRLCLNA
jgi:hypothetical protein